MPFSLFALAAAVEIAGLDFFWGLVLFSCAG
jgi:hypothetical protein